MEPFSVHSGYRKDEADRLDSAVHTRGWLDGGMPTIRYILLCLACNRDATAARLAAVPLNWEK